jgi:hypothetical protein
MIFMAAHCPRTLSAMNRLYLLFAWAICFTGIYFELNEMIWRAIRSVGLGGHPIGVVFVAIPFFVLAVEWLVVAAVPVWFVMDYIKSFKARGKKGRK